MVVVGYAAPATVVLDLPDLGAHEATDLEAIVEHELAASEAEVRVGGGTWNEEAWAAGHGRPPLRGRTTLRRLESTHDAAISKEASTMAPPSSRESSSTPFRIQTLDRPNSALEELTKIGFENKEGQWGNNAADEGVE